MLNPSEKFSFIHRSSLGNVNDYRNRIYDGYGMKRCCFIGKIRTISIIL